MIRESRLRSILSHTCSAEHASMRHRIDGLAPWTVLAAAVVHVDERVMAPEAVRGVGEAPSDAARRVREHAVLEPCAPLACVYIERRIVESDDASARSNKHLVQSAAIQIPSEL